MNKLYVCAGKKLVLSPQVCLSSVNCPKVIDSDLDGLIFKLLYSGLQAGNSGQKSDICLTSMSVY